MKSIRYEIINTEYLLCRKVSSIALKANIEELIYTSIYDILWNDIRHEIVNKIKE